MIEGQGQAVDLEGDERLALRLKGGQELVSAAPQRTERYQIIAQCAAALREMREVQLSSARFGQLAARFEAAVAEHPARIANMGAILVSAVTDEAWIAAGAVTAKRPVR